MTSLWSGSNCPYFQGRDEHGARRPPIVMNALATDPPQFRGPAGGPRGRAGADPANTFHGCRRTKKPLVPTTRPPEEHGGAEKGAPTHTPQSTTTIQTGGRRGKGGHGQAGTTPEALTRTRPPPQPPLGRLADPWGGGGAGHQRACATPSSRRRSPLPPRTLRLPRSRGPVAQQSAHPQSILSGRWVQPPPETTL